MKKLLIGMVMMAMSISLFATTTNEWFTAKFDGTESEGGDWVTNTTSVTVPTFVNNKLELEDVPANTPVEFQIEDGYSPTNGYISIASKIKFTACEELPVIPADAKTAITVKLPDENEPPTTTNYWVVGIGATGTNEWINTEIPADLSTEVPVVINIYTNDNSDAGHAAAFFYFGNNSWDTTVTNSAIQTADFVGNGTVSTFKGVTADYHDPVVKYSVEFTINGEYEDDFKVTNRTELTETIVVDHFTEPATGRWEVNPVGAIITCDTNFNWNTSLQPDPTQKFLADIKKASAGGKVTATGNITVTSPINVDKSITLDLNDKTLTCSGEWAIDVTNAVVTISNGTITASNKGVRANVDAGIKLYDVNIGADNRAVQISSTNTANNIYSGTFTSTSEAAVVGDGGAAAFISGGTFTGPTPVANNLLVAGKKFVVSGTTQTVENLAQVTLTITENNATVSGITSGTVVEGSNLVFTVAAESGYNLTSVTINGTEKGTSGPYNYTVETENITIIATATKQVSYYDVTFSTNGVANVVGTTNVAENTTLVAGHIPAIFSTIAGEWDVNPLNAVITCNTNFNFNVLPPPGPGGQEYDDPQVATNVANAINNAATAVAKAKLIGNAYVGMTEEAKVVYAAYVSAVVVDDTRVELKLNADGEVALSNQVATATQAIAIGTIAAGTSSKATITNPIPGMWYNTIYGDIVTTLKHECGAVQYKGTGSVEFTLNKLESPATAGFYRLKAGIKADDVGPEGNE